MSDTAALFQKSKMPLYLQVAKLLRRNIESGVWRLGDQIPTLDELETEYNVSRITLRAALDQLEALGIVRRTRGLGTFVAKDLSDERWFKLATTLDDLVNAVADLEIRLLPIEDGRGSFVTPAFAYGTVAPAYHRLHRVHYRNDVPYCLINLYLDQQIFDRRPKSFTSHPVIPQLVKLPRVRIGGARQIVRISVSNDITARHLSIGVGDPIAHVFRSIVDTRNRLIYYAEIEYPAQMFEIDIDLLKSQ